MFVIGSPEWFNYQATNKEFLEKEAMIEDWRYSFLEHFSPDSLREMSGAELLEKVFSNRSDSMIQLLMFDNQYRNFGASGKYVYTSVVFQTIDGKWKYKENQFSNEISREEAEEKAIKVRDMLLECVEKIEEEKLDTIKGYQNLSNSISNVFFSQYAWVIKYYQMIFPYYFPGMYADVTIDRALKILGLPHCSNRLINCGQISLFIRKCDINNITFNEIYAKQWGWDKTFSACPNAKDNYANCEKPVKTINRSHYKFPTNNEDLKREALDIDTAISALKLLGKDKEAVVKIRVNQGKFREKLISKYHKCCLCGVSNQNLLIASHIKPWVDSTPEEKVDLNNGFLLCPNHDKLFDRGYISFDEIGNILISNEINEVDRIFLNAHSDMKIKITEENKAYLKYHRENIFKK